jgi:serine protease Do
MNPSATLPTHEPRHALLGRTFAALLAAGVLHISAQAASLPDLTPLIEQNQSAVVNIRTTRTADEPKTAHGLPSDQELPEFFKRFFEQMPERRSPPEGQAIGSGFIMSADGYIITNAHVVADADSVTVRLRDRRELPAKVVGADERTDIALLKVAADGLPTVKLGDSDQLKVGQWVLAIGSPFGFEYSATQGVVSALSRSLPDGTYVPFIQTDVAVNPGNSGGPLFDMDGKVIGVNSQIYSRSGGYMGLSFAIPINVAKTIAGQLQSKGYVERGWLGVAIQDVDQKLAQAFNLDKPKGALVSQVTPGSPADQAGLRSGDVIVRYAGTEIERSSTLPPRVGETAVGTSVKLEVLRDGQPRDLTVTIEKLAEEPVAATRTGGPVSKGRLGVAVRDLEPQQREVLDLPQGGALVSGLNPDGPAATAGLLPNDVIVEFNRQPVRNASQLLDLVKQAPAGKTALVLVKRPQGTLFIAVPLADKDVG